MKALDIVKTPKGGIGFVTETNNGGKEISITYIGNLNPGHEHNAWWKSNELEIIDSVPRMLAMATAHPFGKGKEDVHLFFNEPKPEQ